MENDGRLYATQVFLGDALYEIDVDGAKPPRKIMEKMGGLNGFEFGPDDMLYGPLWFKGQIAKVDVDKGELTVVADALAWNALGWIRAVELLEGADLAHGYCVGQLSPLDGHHLDGRSRIRLAWVR